MPALTEGIVLIVEYRVPLDNQATFIARMHNSCIETLADKGCTRMEFTRSIDDDEVFFLTERWDHQRYIDIHRRKPNHDEEHRITDVMLTHKRVRKSHVYANAWDPITFISKPQAT